LAVADAHNGSAATDGRQPMADGGPMLELYQYEECPFCRVVREKLTELALDYICRNAPPGRPDKDRPLIAISGGTKVPFLVDADAGVYLFGPQKIIAYLEDKYGEKE
jgi:glutathione S-transferase